MEHTRAFLAYDTLCRIAAEIPEDGEQLLEQCEEEAHGLERTLSMFDPDSELSRLCRDIRPGEAVPVSETLYTFLEQNLEICRLSSGAFDPTVGPVVKLWDFLSQTPRIPSAERIRAAVKAVETVDSCVGRVVDATLKMGGIAMITADHGNAEQMAEPDGSPMTAHTTNPVPFILCGAGTELRPNGRLADIAPTMLDVMGLACPEEMDGKTLIVK